MNIFRIHPNKWESARLLAKYDPVRARKQLLESCQIIASVQHILTGRTDLIKADGTPYKAAHRHHPCVTHSAKHISQYEMLLDTTEALAAEYPNHACAKSFRAAYRQLNFERVPIGQECFIVVRRNHEHTIVSTVTEYAALMRQYLVDTKGFPVDANV